MAIYHMRIKVYGRKKGASAIAKAAYRAGMLLVDDETGTRHDYRRRHGVLRTRCFAPVGAPDWASDPQSLWRETHAKEKRKDSTLAREFEIALPHEVTDEQRAAISWDICRELIKRYGFAIQASIHAPPVPGGLNYHFHALATTRRLAADGLADKTRELDHPTLGKCEVEWVREMVARRINHELSEAQIDVRVDHRNIGEQLADALDRGDLEAAAALATREKTEPMGERATALQRRGADCAVGDMNAKIRRRNALRHARLRDRLVEEGYLPAIPTGHSHTQALSDRQRETAAALILGHRSGSIASVEGLGDVSKATQAERCRAKEEATRVEMAEAAGLWTDEIATRIGMAFEATRRLLRQQAQWAAAFCHVPVFRADVRAFLKCLKRLKHDAFRFARRMEAFERSSHLLGVAQAELMRFENEHPRPGLWQKREWQMRRTRRLQAVAQHQRLHDKATEAVSPDAQADYAKRARQTGEEMERMSASLLKQYPMPAEQAPQVAEVSDQMAPEKPRTPRGPRM